jgi:hypothetical protein
MLRNMFMFDHQPDVMNMVRAERDDGDQQQSTTFATQNQLRTFRMTGIATTTHQRNRTDR